MRHLVLAAATVIVIAALAGCGGERSGQAPAAGTGKGGANAAGKTTARASAHSAAGTTAGSSSADAAVPATQPAAPATKAINTICPVTGLAVDASIPPVEVVIDVVQPPMLLLIGANNAEAAKRIAADPERFAAAARNNREARDPRVPAAGAGQR